MNSLEVPSTPNGLVAAPQRRILIPYKPREWAKGFHASMLRWAVMILHRRAGKTTSVINHHIRYEMDNNLERRRLRFHAPYLSDADIAVLLRARNYGHIMPSYKQAKLVAWDMLKYYSEQIPGIKKNEAELSIR